MGVIPYWIQDFPWGGTNLQRICLLVKTYAKMKELDPIVGGLLCTFPPGSVPQYGIDCI